MSSIQSVVPDEFAGLVVSNPLSELPVVNAKQIKNTTELHLGSRGLEVLWGFELFVNLEVLWINNNKVMILVILMFSHDALTAHAVLMLLLFSQLTDLLNLDACVRLQHLVAQGNRIRYAICVSSCGKRAHCTFLLLRWRRTLVDSSLQFMKFLRILDVSNNAIADLNATLDALKSNVWRSAQILDSCAVLARCDRVFYAQVFLEHLDMYGNPVAEEASYRPRVIDSIPSLTILDRHKISAVDRQAATRK
jgi:Leucine-rich repeat (LRR) protein